MLTSPLKLLIDANLKGDFECAFSIILLLLLFELLCCKSFGSVLL